jgi:ABC-type bacteriocin/lantibiotic exporter with double-glycine peptidase domain
MIYFRLLLRIIKKLTIRRKVSIFIFFILTCLVAFADIASISLVIPFIDLMLYPDKVISYSKKIIFFLDLDQNKILISVTIFFIFFVTLSSFLKILIYYLGTKITNLISYELNIIIYQKILKINYISDKKLDENVFLSTIQKIPNLSGFFFSFINMFSSLLIFLFIFSFLIFFSNFYLWLMTGVVIFLYFTITNLVKQKLHSNSRIETEFIYKKNLHINNTISLIKDVILNNLQKKYLDNFKNINYKIVNSIISSNVISYIPGIVIVNFSIIVLIIFIFYLNLNNNLLNLIPILSAMVFGAQKAFPLLQQVYSNFAKIRANYQQTQSLISYIGSFENVKSKFLKNKKIEFTNEIYFKNISYKYPGSTNYILKKINLKILKGDKILITGKSGSGKSTLINILLGFYRPNSGNIIIDKRKIKFSYFSRFQNNFSYCPQNIFLAKDSFYNNIALTFNNEKFSKDKIIKSSKVSLIHNYINGLSRKYKSNIFQGAKNLSGGQLQRIGISRTLYKNASIFIFDESTNALDKKTEEIFLKNLIKTLKDKTVIFISHNLNKTLFNKIFLLKNKQLSLMR